MKKIFIMSFLSALFAQSSFAQAPMASLPIANPTATPATSIAPQNTAPVTNVSAVNGNPSMGIFESAGAERTMDKVFDVNKDSLDTDNGTLVWKGKTFAIGDSRMVRARFERYLAIPVNKESYEQYVKILDEIELKIGVENFETDKEETRKIVRAAWARLFDAAEYSFDGKTSLNIANVVAHTWRMQGDFDSFKWAESLAKEELDRRKAGSMSRMTHIANENMALLKKSNKYMRGQLEKVGDARLGELKARDAEYVGEQAATVLSATTVRQMAAINSVLEFQSIIFSNFVQRKFQQSQICSMFYKNMFKATKQELQVGKEKVTELFGLTNYVPQVSIFETMARDARKDVADGMKAVEFLYDSGQKYSALERLMETFVLGEYEPIVQSFDNEKRLQLLNIYKKSSTIKKLVDSKDWGGIEKIVNELKEVASDYPATEILSNVKAAMQASNMQLLAAKQAAATKDMNGLKASLAEAVKLWPLNPAIDEFNKKLVDFAEGGVVYTAKFDENYERRNFRNIVAEAPEYGIAFRQDTVRVQKLKDVVEKITRIDAYIAQANEMYKQHNPYLAWDLLENAKQIDGDDPELARTMIKLAPEVSDYVKLIARANSAENSLKFAAALNLYLAAQEIYPASQVCRMGIERVSSKYVK